MKLFVKYMVSDHCKMIVKQELDELGLHHLSVELGEVEVMEKLSSGIREKLKSALLKSGLELMDDHRAILIERIRNLIEGMVNSSEAYPKINISWYLSDKLNHDYTYLANLFSEVTGTTIEHYLIARKIERVKELLIYGELNLTEISYKMCYSSVAHLSYQFKKVTGLTPTFFRQIRNKKCQSGDKL